MFLFLGVALAATKVDLVGGFVLFVFAVLTMPLVVWYGAADLAAAEDIGKRAGGRDCVREFSRRGQRRPPAALKYKKILTVHGLSFGLVHAQAAS